MRKWLVALMVISLAGSLLFATGTAETTTAQKSDVTIRVLAGSIPWTDFIKTKLPEFTTQTGIKVEIESYPEDVLRNKAVVELTSRSKDFDVYTTSPPQEMLMFANNGWIAQLDEFIAKSPEYDIDDYMPGAIAGSRTGGNTYSIPLFTERPVLYYRSDLFAQNGLTPPKTFDEMLSIAAKLNTPDKKLYGFVERGAGNASVTQFVTFLRGFGGDYQSTDYHTATINTPEAIKAYKYYGEILRKYGPPGVLNMNWGETSNIFTEGLAAMRIDNDSQYGRVVDKSKSAVWDKVEFAVVPNGPAGLSVCNVAPWALMIPSFSTKQDSAWEFIKWSTSKEMSLLAMQAGQFGARQSTWNNPKATETLPASLVQAVKDSMGSKYSIERPVTIQVGKSRDIIGTVIQAAIQGVGDAELQQIANKANADFQKILDEDYKK